MNITARSSWKKSRSQSQEAEMTDWPRSAKGSALGTGPMPPPRELLVLCELLMPIPPPDPNATFMPVPVLALLCIPMLGTCHRQKRQIQKSCACQELVSWCLETAEIKTSIPCSLHACLHAGILLHPLAPYLAICFVLSDLEKKAFFTFCVFWSTPAMSRKDRKIPTGTTFTSGNNNNSNRKRS